MILSKAIGIFDSGLGGLSVWAEVVRLMPNLPIIYYADSANCPYGEKDKKEIIELTEKGVKWLIKNGVGIIILACNTATGAAIEELRAKFTDVIFIGTEPAIKKAAEITKSGIVGVLATKYTLSSKKYLTTKSIFCTECQILEQVGEGLVELVESGETYTSKAKSLLRKYIIPFMKQKADVLVLGCTHYPFLSHTIDYIVKEKMIVINSAPYVAKRLQDIIDYKQMHFDAEYHFKFHSTISPTHSRYIRTFAMELIDLDEDEN